MSKHLVLNLQKGIVKLCKTNFYLKDDCNDVYNFLCQKGPSTREEIYDALDMIPSQDINKSIHILHLFGHISIFKVPGMRQDIIVCGPGNEDDDIGFEKE